MDRTTQDRPTARTHLGLTLRVLSHLLQHQSANPSLSQLEIVSLASRSKGTLFGQLNVRHAFNMTRGTSNDRSLIDTDGITIVQNPIRLRPISVYPSTLGYFL
jgi:hypothetical protein